MTGSVRLFANVRQAFWAARESVVGFWRSRLSRRQPPGVPDVDEAFRALVADVEVADDGFSLDYELASRLAAIEALWGALPARVVSYERLEGSRTLDGKGVWVLRIIPMRKDPDGMFRPGDPSNEVMLTVGSPRHWIREPRRGDYLLSHRDSSGVSTLWFKDRHAHPAILVTSDLNRV